MEFDPLYLGRLQQGEELRLVLQCTDASGTPADPAVDPVVTIYRDVAGVPTFVESVKLAGCERGVVDGLFRKPHFLGSRYSNAGRYLLVYRWQVGANGFTRAGSFFLIPGGSADGAAIAMSFVARPDANHLLTQTDSGQLVRGRNPR